MVVKKKTPGQNSDVRYSPKGYIYSELGRSGDITGVVKLGNTSQRPPIKEVPPGTFYYNTDTNTLELSDTQNQVWIGIQTAGSGSDFIVGNPSDGTYSDGAISINPSGTVADAIDDINEYLLSCCSGIVAYSSHLGTTDGTTNGYLDDPALVLGRVASPTSTGIPYYTNSWDDDTNRDINQSSSFNWELNAGEKITDLQDGTLTVRYTNGNGSVVHTETLNLDGSTSNQSSTPSGYCSVSSLSNFQSKIEGFISISIPSLLLLGDSGYLKVSIDHVINTSTFSQSLEFFLDSETSPSVVSGNISLGTYYSKYLSGVQFATISGSNKSSLQFDLSASGIWSDTYRADPVLVDSSDFGITDYVVSYNSSDVTKEGISPPLSPFKHNEDFEYSAEVEINSTTVINPDSNGNFSSGKFTVRDPFSSVDGSDITPLILINTYPSVSTDSLELFLDEDYRLLPNSGTSALSSINGLGRGALAWDSTKSLATFSGLQVINGALIYPQDDYSSYDPTPNPDYSSLSGSLGNLVFKRRFRDALGTARSNGVFKLNGLTETFRNNKDVLIDIRVVGDHITGSGIQGPGNEGTGWLSLNEDYNSSTFTGDDGDGCFVQTGGYSAPDFEFTLGGFSTAYASNDAIEVRVTFKNPEALSFRLTRIQITNWN